jgi:hypothetical protein
VAGGGPSAPRDGKGATSGFPGAVTVLPGPSCWSRLTSVHTTSAALPSGLPVSMATIPEN